MVAQQLVEIKRYVQAAYDDNQCYSTEVAPAVMQDDTLRAIEHLHKQWMSFKTLCFSGVSEIKKHNGKVVSYSVPSQKQFVPPLNITVDNVINVFVDMVLANILLWNTSRGKHLYLFDKVHWCSEDVNNTYIFATEEWLQKNKDNHSEDAIDTYTYESNIHIEPLKFEEESFTNSWSRSSKSLFNLIKTKLTAHMEEMDAKLKNLPVQPDKSVLAGSKKEMEWGKTLLKTIEMVCEKMQKTVEQNNGREFQAIFTTMSNVQKFLIRQTSHIPSGYQFQKMLEAGQNVEFKFKALDSVDFVRLVILP